MKIARRSFATLAFLSSFPIASNAELSQVILEIEVSNSAGAGTIAVLNNQCDWDTDTRTVTWTLPDLQILENASGQFIGAVYLADVQIAYSPRGEVRASLGVLAGPQTTTVRIWSPELAFSPLPSTTASVRGTIAFNVSDEDSSGLAMMTALGAPGSGSYKAYYGAGGTDWKFADQIWRVQIESQPGQPAGQANASDAVPRSGFLLTNRPTDSIYWTSGFTITPGDAVEVTGTASVNASVPFVTCDGDADRDLLVDLDDATLVLGSFGFCSVDADYDWRADVSYNNCVDLEDVLVVLGNFGETCD